MNIPVLVINLFVLLFAITIHEASHGWAAWKMGDSTARALGRVTLNPIAHIDLFGTIIVPLLLVIARAPAFGWAKPVPVNPYNLRHPRQDSLWISLAGPAANLAAGATALVLLVLLKAARPGTVDFLLGFLTGRGSLPPGFYPLEGLALILFYAVLINIYLAVFNLIPVPPLDGSGILAGLLSDEAAARYDRLRPYGFFLVLILVYAGVLNVIIRPVEQLILRIIFS